MNPKRKKNKTVYFTAMAAVSLFTSCSEPTTACFSYSPGTVAVNTDVTFTSACSENASYFTWHFGDGSRDTTVGSLTVTHRFTAAGSYTVRLTAERKDGVSVKKGKEEATQVVLVQ